MNGVKEFLNLFILQTGHLRRRPDGRVVNSWFKIWSFNVYLPPTASTYSWEMESHNGIAFIELFVMDIIELEDLGDVPFILFGDFNARTGNKTPENEQ